MRPERRRVRMDGTKLSEVRHLLDEVEQILPEVATEGDAPMISAELRTFGRELHASRVTLEELVSR
jgi:hypothetical protein